MGQHHQTKTPYLLALFLSNLFQYSKILDIGTGLEHAWTWDKQRNLQKFPELPKKEGFVRGVI